MTASTAFAQAAIDSELRGQLDFRDGAYRACLDQTECTVNGLTITGERRVVETAPWEPAKIYWDPIDGLGITDGAQNDEIDFSERLVIEMDAAQTVSKVWFSDLFHSEDDRYGSGDTDRIEGVAEDAEVAAMNLINDGTTVAAVVVEAKDRLPWASFNQEITWRFREEGDLRRRVLIDRETVRIVAPGEDGRGRVKQELFKVGEIDPEKLSIFDGVETVEIDISGILAEFNGLPLFVVGTQNFDLVRSLTEDPAQLVSMRQTAETKRQTINMSNGELAHVFDAPQAANRIEFFAPFDASNDFSVAGIITQ